MLVFSFGAYIKTPWSPPPQQKESKRDTASLGCLLPWFTGFTALDWKSWHVPGVERKENRGTCGESSWRSALLPVTHSRGVLQDKTLTGELLWWPGRKNVILWRQVITWTLGWSLWATHVCERFPGLSSSQAQGERTNRGQLVAIRFCTCTGAAWEGINTQVAPEKKQGLASNLKNACFFNPLYSPNLLASGWLSPTRRSICNSVFQRVAASILQAEATSTSERLHRDRNILHRQSTSVMDTSQTTQSLLSWSPNTTTPCTQTDSGSSRAISLQGYTQVSAGDVQACSSSHL